MPREMVENERSTAINPRRAVEENVSLSDRFGLWIGFHNCSQDDYLDMVRGYAEHYRPAHRRPELDRDALDWATARQPIGRVACNSSRTCRALGMRLVAKTDSHPEEAAQAAVRA